MRTLFRRLRHSLSARLMLLFLLSAAAIVFVLMMTIGSVVSHHFKREIRPHIVQYIDYIQQDIGNPPDIEKAKRLSQRVPVDIYIRGSEVNWASTPIPLDLSDVHFHSHRRYRDGRYKNFEVDEEDNRFILRTKTGSHDIYYVVASGPEHRSGGIALIAIAVLLLLLYLLYLFIRRLFRPVTDIQQGVKQFASGQLDYRIPIRRQDELGDLGDSINDMAAQIEKMLDAKRQLLLAISHELRSPITRAKVSLELLDESRTKEDISQDIREMETLIGEILETERLDQKHSVLNKSVNAVNALVEEVIAEHFPDQNINTELSDTDPHLLLDTARIKLLIKNLLQNAIRHNRSDRGTPKITTAMSLQQDKLQIIIADHGIGIAPEHLPHLTEPFYRVDPSRQRKTGGYGLGLYLCRVIVEAHGGRLLIDSRIDEGTDVIVELPAAD